MAGAAIFLVALNLRLGLAALAPAVGVLRAHAGDRRLGEAQERCRASSRSAALSGEIQESMSNFQVIVAFNRVDYFRQQFDDGQRAELRRVGRAPAWPTPSSCRSTASRYNLAQLIVLAYGFYLIAAGQLHGRPADRLSALREQLLPAAAPARRLWSSFQLALAASTAFPPCSALESNMPQLPAEPRPTAAAGARVRARAVQLSAAAQQVLRDATFALERGQDLRAGRTDRRRQDDDRVADGAALRPDAAAACCSTAGTSARITPEERAQKHRLHSPGAVPLHRHDPRQHRLRQRRAAAAARTRSRGASRRRRTSTACSRASSRGSRRRSRPAATASASGRSS